MLQRLIFATTLTSLIFMLAGCIKPYQAPVQQGNILTTKNVDSIHTGMTSQQVSQILGKPILTNLYRNNLSTYVYTYQARNTNQLSKQQLIISFKNNRVTNIQNTQQP